MSMTGEFKLSVIKHHFGYMEFSVCFLYGSDLWNANGMSWLSTDSPNYYLSAIYLNGIAATSYDLIAAGIFQTDQSIRFKCRNLASWATSGLRQYWNAYLNKGANERGNVHVQVAEMSYFPSMG
jgi:NADPH-dependent 7-cyano-7-deazaguanine reductase QueF-like protein